VRVVVAPAGPVEVAETVPVPRPVTLRLAVAPLLPVTVVCELPPPYVVARVALWPLGPVTVALVAPGTRLTLRVADWPLGPVTVDCTLPPPRRVDRVAVLPPGPVTVEELLTWAEAARVDRASKETVTARVIRSISSFPKPGLSYAPADLLRTAG
jgi:hypothetical protein